MTDPIPPSKPNELSFTEETHPPSFNAWDPQVLRKIDELVALAANPPNGADNRDLVREMIVTSLKAQSAGLDRGDVKILNRAIRELRYGFRIFQPFRDRRKVTIFGSARTPKTDREYRMALAFSKKIAAKGFMVITGAGPGIMRAGNEGAGADNSFGINIRLPFEQHANQFIAQDTKFVDCRFFFTRKLMFLKETSAVALFPGGFGTHDEGMEALTLVQTGKCDPLPVVFVEPPGSGYWSDWKKYMVKHLLKKVKISPEDMNLFRVVKSADEAVREITGFYRNYHSMRYVKDLLVMYLEKPPTPAFLQECNTKFKDICKGGAFTAPGPFPEETRHRDLPRIAFPFNRYNFGRLRQLIDMINERG